MQYLLYRVSNTHRQLMSTCKAPKLRQPKAPNNFSLFVLLGVGILLFSWRPFVTYDENGNAVLAEWREDKLNRELNNMEQAEQYVLVAKSDGSFPCFSCRGDPVIYLKKGE